MLAPQKSAGEGDKGGLSMVPLSGGSEGG